MGIKLKRSAVASKVPTTADLELGELAVNTYDGKLFIKKDNGTASIVEIGASGSVANGSITTAKLGGDITAAGKALLDDADAAAQRTTLGLGALATKSAITSADITDLTIATGDIADAAVSTAKIADGAVGTAKLGGDITAAGKALLDDADAAAQRATLGLVIGTNVQAYDAELAAIAGLVSAADRLPYFTGASAAALATFTAAGRALLDDADAAAQRVTLGLGSLATKSTITSADITDLAIATTDIADGAVSTAKLGVDITTAGKALLDDADAATQRVTLGLGSLAVLNSVSLTSNATGVLPLANGGTNANLTAAAGGVLYSTASALALTAAGSAGQAFVSNGTSAPAWATLTLENLPGAWVKRAVKVATTANITLSGTQTIDGVAVVAGDRVLVKNQTTASANGIYVVSATAWTRAADADAADEIAGGTVSVEQGSTQSGSLWSTTFKTTDTLGTTAMTWVRQFDTSQTLNVANGGTGVTTLTGLVKGNGTGAFTAAVAGTDYAAASHTHTASQISDSTAAGRAILTAADAAAQRVTLGLFLDAALSDFNCGTASTTSFDLVFDLGGSLA